MATRQCNAWWRRRTRLLCLPVDDTVAVAVADASWAPPSGDGVDVGEGNCVWDGVPDGVGEDVAVGVGVVVVVAVPLDVGVPVAEPVPDDASHDGGDGHRPGTFVGRAIVSEITLHDDGLLHEPTWVWSGK